MPRRATGDRRPARQHFVRRRMAALAVVALLAPIGSLLPARPAIAAGSPNITLTETAPSTILYGTDAAVSLVAANPGGGSWGYNLSLEDVLPTAVSYVAGTTTPATVGDPTILANQPVAGQTTLIWSNVGDLSPGSGYTLGFHLRAATDTGAPPFLLPNNSYTDHTGAYVNSDPRFVPSFTAAGTPVPASFTGSATALATTTISPIAATKTEPSPEGELMRGVHDHQTVYTITVQNNRVHPTNGIVVDDWLPAGLEFLRCGQTDNSTNAPTNAGSAREYPGATSLSGHVGSPASCTPPTSVDTVSTDPDGAGPLPTAVYTHVQWTGLGNLAASGSLTIRYVAAIPIRENTLVFSGVKPTAASLGQAADLDNNNGPETTDEQTLTNYVTATGTYSGTLGGGSNPVVATAYATVTAENLATQKIVSDPVFAAGKHVTFTISVETSEYRYADATIVTDTLPSGLCPLGGVNYDAHAAPDCAPVGTTPSPAYTSVAENPDGSFTITWNLGHLNPSATPVITMPAADRGSYQANSTDTTPTLGNDSSTNSASVVGNVSVACVGGDTSCAIPNALMAHDDPATVNGVADATSAAQTAAGPAITKSVAQSVAAGATLDCSTATYLTKVSPGYPPTYQKGDRICFRINVSFPAGTEFRDPLVDDFIPPNTTYEAGSQTTTAANTAPSVGFSQPAAAELQWTMGTPLVPPNGSNYVNGGSTFEADFSVIAIADPTVGNSFDLTQNLAKLVTSNTAGATFAVRDMATFQLAAPILGLVKAVTFINGVAAPQPKNDVVRGADVVSYGLTVSDSGIVDAYNAEVWDVLPAQESCAEVSNITPASGVCNVAANTIKWPAAAVAHIIVGGSATLSFDLAIRPDAGAGETFVNTAGVRTFEGHHNNSGQPVNTYYPATNIDGTVTVGQVNAPNARDAANVVTAGAVVVKSRTTSITTAGNANTDATIGETISYSVALTVPHNTTFYTASMSDPLGIQQTYVAASGQVTVPSGTVYAEGSPIPGGFTYAYNGGSNTVSFTFPAVYANATAFDQAFTITFAVTVADVVANARAANISNVATLTDHSSGGGLLTFSNAPLLTRVVEPAIALTKTLGNARVQPGGTATFTIHVNNQALAGSTSAFDLAGSDPIPANLNYVAASVALSGPAAGTASQAAGTISWSIPGPLDPGQIDLITFQVQPIAPASLTNGQTFANAATLTAWNGVSGHPAGTRGYGPVIANSTLTMDFPKPTVVKTMPNGSTAFATTPFSWRVKVTNTATVAVANTLSVSDTLPPNWTYNVGSTTVTPPIGPVTHPDPIVTPNAGGDALAWAGLGTLQPGQALTIDYTATPSLAAQTTPGTGPTNPHTNTAAATVTDNTGAAGNASGPYASANVTAQALIGRADLALTKTHAGNFSAGANGIYTLTVHNGGPSTVSLPVTVTDDMVPPETFVSAIGTGWGCAFTAPTVTCTLIAALASGADSNPITLTVHTPSSTADATSVTNSATVTSPTFDNNLANNTATDPTTVNANADLVMAKTHAGNFTAGRQGTYTLSASNSGPSDALGPLTVTDTMPAGESLSSAGGSGWVCNPPVGQTFSCGNPSGLATGATATPISVVVDVAATQAPGSIGNTASATSPTHDPNAVNNTATDNTAIVTSADLAITKVHAGGFVSGQPATYNYTVTNAAGPSDAAGPLTVSDTLPGGESFISGGGFATGWACGNIGALVTCSHAGGLAVGGTLGFSVTVAIGSGVISANLTNSASVSSATTPDPVGANNSSTDIGPTIQTADLQITKVHNGAFVAGQNATYTIAVNDAGPSDAAGTVTVTDILRAGESFVAGGGGATGWGCGVAAATVTCNHVASIVAGAAASSFTLTVHVAPDVLPGGITNAASVTSPTTDPDGSNNSRTDTVSSTTSADLAITKTDNGAFTAGASGQYILGVTNNGPSDAAGAITVTDTLPVGETFVSGGGGGSGWACGVSGQTVTCTDPAALPAGQVHAALILTVLVSTSVTPGTLTNTAVVSSPSTDPDGTNNTVSRDTAVGTSADLALVKAHSGAFVSGQNGSYTFTVNDIGPSDAAGPLTVTDTLPVGETFVSVSGGGGGSGWVCGVAAGTVTCTKATGLALNATSGFGMTVAIASGLGASSISNTATVSSSTPDPNGANNSSTDNTGNSQSADVEIVKTHVGPFVAGRNATYNLAVSDNGPSDAAGPITVTDTLPAGETFVSGVGGGWGCGAAAGTVTCTHNAALISGAVATSLVLTVSIAPDVPAGVVSNTATASSPTADPTPGNNTDTDDVSSVTSADLSITKTDDGPFTAGTVGHYMLGVSNAGPSDAAGVIQVVDTLPVGESFQSGSGTRWSCGASGQTVTCTDPATLRTGQAHPALTLSVSVAASVAAGTLTNTASVASVTADPAPDNNLVSRDTGIVTVADLSLIKVHSGAFIASRSADYTMTVVDNGPSDAAGPLSLTDTLPAGETFVSGGTGGGGNGWSCGAAGQDVTCTRATSIAAGATSPFTLTVALAPNFASATVTNTAHVTGPTTDPVAANNGSTDTVDVIRNADLAITKVHSGAFVAGMNAIYTIDVANNGPADAISPVIVTDVLPATETYVSAAGTGWLCGNLGQTAMCTFAGIATGAGAPTITLTVSLAPGLLPQSIGNTASVTSMSPDPTPGNNSSTDTVASTTSADLSITKTDNGPFTAGTSGQYTLTVSNNGPSDAAGAIQVVDTLPVGETYQGGAGTGWTCGVSGQTVTCTDPAVLPAGQTHAALILTVLVSTSVTPGTLTNTAVVSSPTTDPNPANDSVSRDTAVSTSADLGLVKAHSGAFVSGQNGSYTFTVNDVGPSDAAGPLTVTDTLPVGETFVSGGGGGWTCGATGQDVSCTRVAGIAVGAAAPFTLMVALTPNFATATVTNMAHVTGPPTDPVPGNNRSTDTADVIRNADLAITKVHNGAFVAGQNATYTIDVVNNGPADAISPVVVTDVLPATETYVGAGGSGWLCGNIAQTAICTFPGIATGAAAPAITLTVSLAPNLLPQSITNTASVTSRSPDPTLGNNRSTDTVASVTSADLALVKTDDGPFIAGTSGHYTLGVTNNGPSDAEGPLTLTDTLPVGETFESWAGGGWTCAAVGNTVTCDHGAGVAPGTSVAVVLTVSVVASVAPGTLSNTATVSSPTVDPDGTNNSSTRVTAVDRSADLRVVKGHTGEFIAGQSATYTVDVGNAGPSDAAGPVTVTDVLPVGETLASFTGSGWSCAEATGTVTCIHNSALPVGSSAAEITLTVALASDLQPQTLTNTAVVGSATADPNATNNTGVDTVSSSASADLSVIKTSKGPFTAGTAGQYTIRVSNAGPSDAAGPVVVSDVLPTGETLQTAAGTGWLCGNVGASLSCIHASPLAAGTAASPLTVTVEVGASVTAASLTNVAHVSSPAADPNSADNLSSVTTPVVVQSAGSVGVLPSDNQPSAPTTPSAAPVPAFDLWLTKTLATGLQRGRPATYRITVGNSGPGVAATPITVTDVLPAELTYVSGVGDGWHCGASGQTVNCTNTAPLGVNATAGFALTADVHGGLGAVITNRASVRAAGDVHAANDVAAVGGLVADVPGTPDTGRPLPWVALLLMLSGVVVATAARHRPLSLAVTRE